jgi:hypothetical protein
MITIRIGCKSYDIIRGPIPADESCILELGIDIKGVDSTESVVSSVSTDDNGVMKIKLCTPKGSS